MTSLAPSRERVLLPWLLTLLLLSLPHHSIASSSFEPYQLNGGLVAAVAGKDYCVVSTDTRMMDGGYEIYTRRHLTSRLWNCDPDGTLISTLCEADGSLKLPTDKEDTSSPTQASSSSSLPLSPTWIASSGCAADCEALKRAVRMEVKASKYWNTHLQVNHVSNLLSQVLYYRRGFPYYSFCVVAGFTSSHAPAAYVYDAIGSYEQVAVATAGTGRELLQPILDRLFASYSDGGVDDETLELKRQESKNPAGCSIGTKRTMPPRVVETQVKCSAEEAVSRLVRGYKSVAERDIGVGDSVVLCVTQRNALDGKFTCKVISVPLKTH